MKARWERLSRRRAAKGGAPVAMFSKRLSVRQWRSAHAWKRKPRPPTTNWRSRMVAESRWLQLEGLPVRLVTLRSWISARGFA
jgi:hypothetical protein